GGDALTFSKVSSPTHGTVTVNANGSFSYTPAAGFSGSDSFTFRAFAGPVLESSTATVSITVTHVNRAPVAAAGTLAVDRNSSPKTGVVTAKDADGDNLTYKVVRAPGDGTVTLQSGGSFSYKPKLNFSGTDSFTFKANDGNVDSKVATVSITVTEHAPVATGGAFSMTHNITHNGTLKATDADSGDKLSFSMATAPKHGKLVITASTGAYTYTPNKGFTGKDSLVFQVSDGDKSDTATINITVN
ncbi:MAG TPA: Ig-like domain-containing protein, partial [Gammaproteobacteria bacterium]|nr:Ig-like domain-containing protein [Gammaproteobacteria bacterium]